MGCSSVIAGSQGAELSEFGFRKVSLPISSGEPHSDKLTSYTSS